LASQRAKPLIKNNRTTKNIMDYTKARKLTLDEFVDVQRAIEKSMYYINVRIAEEKERMQKAHSPNMSVYHKDLHASYVVEAEELSALLYTLRENGPALWEYPKSDD
jgi:hypothetical protein